MKGDPFSYPCRFKRREDGSYFIRFPDLPEAMVDRVEESDLHRSAAKCLASVLYWRITNEIELPLPSPPRAGQRMIELGLARALGEAIAQGRRRLSEDDRLAASPARSEAPSGDEVSRPAPMPRDQAGLGSLAAGGA